MFKSLNLKNILAIYLLSFSLLAFNLYLLTTAPAFAQPSLSSTIDCDATLPPSDPKSCNIPAFIKFLKNLINYAVGISIPLATGFIVYGAFQIMTAGGNTGKVDSGKKIIYAAVIGVAIALGSYIIIQAILNLIPATPQFK